MRRPHRSDPSLAEAYSGPSKSQVKRELHDLQDLGVALLSLPEATLDALVTDERLRTALRDLRRIDARSAGKRQRQYVGKLLRDEDLAPLRRALEDLHAGQTVDRRALHAAEEWRAKLLADDAAAAAFARSCPAADQPQLQRLVREARREPARGRAFRELFRAIRAALAKG